MNADENAVHTSFSIMVCSLKSQKLLAGVMEYTNIVDASMKCFHEMRTLRVELWSHVLGQATSSMLMLGPSI